MEKGYRQEYFTNNISTEKLTIKILRKFAQYDCNEARTYDQLLFILDKQCNGEKCNRQIYHELYLQVCNVEQKCSIKSIVQSYVDNLQTCKLCSIRNQRQLGQLQAKIADIKNRKYSFVYLKLLQASVYSRFTPNSIFSYRINPSNIPPITLQKALNPVLDHEFTLQLENQTSFSFIFYQSGINIFQWSFPDDESVSEGQYKRFIKSENIQFEIMIKYVPKQNTELRENTAKQLKKVREQDDHSKSAFFKLCEFTPFQKHTEAHQAQSNSTFFDKVSQKLPFLKEHARNLHFLLLLYILIQCWLSYYTAIQFLDIILGFYLLGLLYDPTQHDLKPKFIISAIILILLILKTLWGIASQSFYSNSTLQTILLILCIALKVILIIALLVCLAKNDELNYQKGKLLMSSSNEQTKSSPRKLSESIWSSVHYDERYYI